MADEQKPKERKERKKVGAPAEGASVSTTKAKAAGKAAGKAAPAAEAKPAPAQLHRVSMKPMKLQKKNKSRLPRKEKKARQKAAAAQSRA